MQVCIQSRNFIALLQFKMTPNQCLKRYFWELSDFVQCSSSSYKDMKHNSIITLYLYKYGHPSVIVKLHSPTEKISSWTFTEVQILQKLNDNPKISHWRSLIFPLKDEVFLSQLQIFTKKLNKQMEQIIPKMNKELERWMNGEMADVLVVSTKKNSFPGGQHTLIEVKSLLRDRYINYFQMKKWTANAWEGLLKISEAENIEKTRSFGEMFEEITSFINSFEAIKEQKYSSLFDSGSMWKQKRKSTKDDLLQNNKERKVLQKMRLYQSFYK